MLFKDNTHSLMLMVTVVPLTTPPIQSMDSTLLLTVNHSPKPLPLLQSPKYNKKYLIWSDFSFLTISRFQVIAQAPAYAVAQPAYAVAQPAYAHAQPAVIAAKTILPAQQVAYASQPLAYSQNLGYSSQPIAYSSQPLLAKSAYIH